MGPADAERQSGLAVPRRVGWQSVTRQVVVQAAKPFRVLAVEADGNLLVSTRRMSAKIPVGQVIPVTITANARSPGSWKERSISDRLEPAGRPLGRRGGQVVALSNRS